MALTYFAAYTSYLDNIEPLDDAERGRLFTACLQYAKTGEVPEFSGNERYVFPAIRSQIERDTEKYKQSCEKQTKNGKLGGRPKKTPTPYGNPNNPTVFSETQKTLEKDKKTEKEIEKNCSSPSIASPKKKYGPYGWVCLTDDEYERLIADLGKDEAKHAIEYVDESAQSTGNKNKWKDWNLVVRKASREGWGKKGAWNAAANHKVLKVANHSQRKYTSEELSKIGSRDLLDEL